MKKHTLQLLLPVVAGSLLWTGCYSHHAAMRQPPTVVNPAGEVVFADPPPEPRREVVGAPPDQHSVWVSGYWVRSDTRWVWVPGHWGTRPTETAKWVPGHWDKNPGGPGWMWTPGYWAKL